MAAMIVASPSCAFLGAIVFCVLRTLRECGLELWLPSVSTFLLAALASYLIARLYGRPTERSLATVVKAPDLATQKEVIDIWKAVIDVQMHFNDMLMRTRNYALTLVLAVLGAAGVALERSAVIDMSALKVGPISLASVLLVVGIIGLFAFYFLDRFYYHPLLVASVAKGTEIEKWLWSTNPAIDLTGTVSAYSRIQVKVPYTGQRISELKYYARNKLTLFYFAIALLLAILASMVNNVGVPKPVGTRNSSGLKACSRPIGSGTVALRLSDNCSAAPGSVPDVRVSPSRSSNASETAPSNESQNDTLPSHSRPDVIQPIRSLRSPKSGALASGCQISCGQPSPREQ